VPAAARERASTYCIRFLGVAVLNISRSSPPRVDISGSRKPGVPDATLLAPVDPGERIDVTVTLRPQSDIPDGYAGGSRDEFERQHGADPADIAKVGAFAQQYGLNVDAVNAPARAVTLSGSAQEMQRAFNVSLAEFRSLGSTYRDETGTISVPEPLANAVRGVFGLDSRAVSESHVHTTAGHASGYTPLDVAKAYDFPSGDGTGEHIGVISLGGRYDDKVQAQYCQSLGVAHVPFNVVKVDGGADNPTDPGPTGENTLDAEVIGSLVPNADKTMYIAPNTDRGFLDAIATALHDKHHNTAISISWGGPEERFAPQAMRAFNELFKEAKAMGVNVFCAAGDNGSDDGVGDGQAHVDFPSSSPSVIANGGTKLITDASGAIATETVWNEKANGSGATGGGISSINPKPPGQHALPIKGRGVPDIAGDADPLTGYRILVPSGNGGKPATELIGGTSAVAPLYAALAARLEQQLGRPLGDFQKAIYDAPADAFHDITHGNNGAFAAGPGWDAVTGRGSIDGTKLLHSLQGAAG